MPPEFTALGDLGTALAVVVILGLVIRSQMKMQETMIEAMTDIITKLGNQVAEDHNLISLVEQNRSMELKRGDDSSPAKSD